MWPGVPPAHGRWRCASLPGERQDTLEVYVRHVGVSQECHASGARSATYGIQKPLLVPTG